MKLKRISKNKFIVSLVAVAFGIFGIQCSQNHKSNAEGLLALAGSATSVPADSGSSTIGGSSSSSGSNSTSTTQTASNTVTASSGGTVKLGSELTLSVPPGSVDTSVNIKIQSLSSIPQGHASGYTYLGEAYEFSPGGTQFALDKPATLVMHYDPKELSSQGLSEDTLQLFYYDENAGQYIAVPTVVNKQAQTMTASIEHFTVYLPLATTQVPGNNPPVLTAQSPVPNQLVADAPIYARATAYDHDIGGSVAGVQVVYRKLQPSPGPYQTLVMKPETNPNMVNTYGAVIPSTFLTTADLGPGKDIEYYFVAYDNLGAPKSTAAVQLDIRRDYNPGSLSLSPNTQSMTAGFQRYFTARAQYTDVQNGSTGSFDLVPETVSVGNSIGVATNQETWGVLFEAQYTNVGTVQAGFGSESGVATVTVYNGALDHIDILDQNKQVINGTFSLKEGVVSQFYAIGYDQFGNHIDVLPHWNVDSTVGTVDQTGLLNTLDGTSYGNLSVSIPGPLGAAFGSASKTIHVLDRSWQEVANNTILGNVFEYPAGTNGNAVSYFTASASEFAFDNNSGYLIYQELSNLGGWSIYGCKFDTNGCVNFSTSPVNGSSTAVDPTIAIVNGQLYAAYTTQPGAGNPNQLYVKAWDGYQWNYVANNTTSLNVNSSKYAYVPRMANINGKLYIVWSEGDESAAGPMVNQVVYVKHLDPTTQTWVQDGGYLNNQLTDNSLWVNIATDGISPYVVFSEYDSSNIAHLIVKKWDGTNWVQLGSELNVNSGASVGFKGADIVFDGSTPYVTWAEEIGATQMPVYLKHWNGNSWVLDGGAVNSTLANNGKYPRLAIHRSVPYIIWGEYNQTNAGYETTVAHLHNGSWIFDAKNMIMQQGQSLDEPSIGFIGDTLFVAWTEDASGAKFNDLYLKAFE